MEVIITTDGTLQNTQLKVDGKDITKNNKVVSISAYASAPFKGQVSGDIYKGQVGVSYEIMDDKGTIERLSIGSSETDYVKGIGQKIKQNDQVLQYLGQAIPAELDVIVDKIVKHCEDNKIACPVKDVLVTRTKESLMDKVVDLGITLES
jgi:hypothetical protein